MPGIQATGKIKDVVNKDGYMSARECQTKYIWPPSWYPQLCPKQL